MDADLTLHRMWLSNPSEGRQADWSGAPRNGEKFTGEDLRRVIAVAASFRESRFYDVDLSGSDLERAGFPYARLHHSNLRETSGRDANFTAARIDHCDFSAAQLSGAKFGRAHLTECCFRGANLEGCDFKETRIKGGDFRGANLWGATGLRSQQIARVLTDETTILPEGLLARASFFDPWGKV